MKKLDFNIDNNLEKIQLGDSDRFIEVDLSDLSLPKRLKTFLVDISKYYNNESDAFNNASNEEKVDRIEDTDKFIREKLDEVFGKPISETVFGRVNCITIGIDGKPYIQEFLEALTPIVVDLMQERTEKFKKNTEKYTSEKGKYSK